MAHTLLSNDYYETEDKLVLIDNGELEEDDNLNLKDEEEVPLSRDRESPLLSKPDPRITLEVNARDSSSSAPPEFATEYNNQFGERYPKSTFRPCSRPTDTTDTSRSQGKCSSFLLPVIGKFAGSFGSTWTFHKRAILSSVLVILSSSGILISFPIHLESVTRGGHEVGDGYSACLVVATVTTLMLLFNCIFLEVWERKRHSFSDSVLRPMVHWMNALKIGFCLGLSFVTIFYSWEDFKVACNLQDPLLGLVIIFAIVTHGVCKWKRIGLKKTFSLASVAAGVFLSVDYPLVDHHRCRGYYFHSHETAFIEWTWTVHMVWTSAFVVSIWLATIAAFFIESSIPVPKVKHNRLYDLEFNAVKLRVMSESNTTTNTQPDDAQQSQRDLKEAKSYRFSPYTHFKYNLVANAVLWFSVATWVIILSLFWTEFIPGFGQGISAAKLPTRILSAFQTSLTSWSSWTLFSSVFIYSQNFTYLTILTRSPMAAMCYSMTGFPIIGLWWSVFQMNYSVFTWMPVVSGELVCAFLGLIAVSVGSYYFIKFEVLQPAQIPKRVGNPFSQ